MKTWGLLRISALLLTAIFVHTTLFAQVFEPKMGSYIFYAFINVIFFSHYILAHTTPITARRLREIAGSKQGLSLLALVTTAVVLSLWYSPDIGLLYSAIHLSLSEVYSRLVIEGDREFYEDQAKIRRVFRAVHFAFMLFVFLSATHHSFLYARSLNVLAPILNPVFLNVGLLVFALTYFAFLALKWRTLFPRHRGTDVIFAYVLPDLLFIPMTIACQLHRVHWSALVLYHVFFWLIFPLLKVKNPKAFGRVALTNVLPTLAITAVFIYFYPAPGAGTPLSAEDIASLNYRMDVAPYAGFEPSIISKEVVEAHKLTMSWGIFHTLFSLALSSLNPFWLRRFGRN